MQTIQSFFIGLTLFNLLTFITTTSAAEIRFYGKVVEFTCAARSADSGCQTIHLAMSEVQQKSILGLLSDKDVENKYNDVAMLKINHLAAKNKKIFMVDYF